MPESDSIEVCHATLIDRLLHHADLQPEFDAMVCAAYTLSYKHLAVLVHEQAVKLHENGISSHSVVGINCADDPKHLLLFLAVTYLGGKSFTLPTYDENLSRDLILKDIGATHVLTENDAIEMDSLQSKPGDFFLPHAGPAEILFSTSGTSGKAKQVVFSDEDIVAQANRHVEPLERFACLASVEHNFAKRHRLYCLAVGATNVFLDADQASLVRQCLSLAVNTLHVSAYQAQELLAVPDIEQLRSLKLKLGGSHVPLSLRRRLRSAITENLRAGYGTTETGAIAFTDPEDNDSGESVGSALPGVEVRVVSPTRAPLAVGEKGELAIRAKGIFRGYHARPDLTEAKLIDGWFYTGDIGYIDAQHRIYVSGRSDEMFVFNSMNIIPQDIEAEIKLFPGVSDALVFSKPSEVHGQIPAALVAYDKNCKPIEVGTLKRFLKKRLGVRCPRHIEFVETIPRNASGKLMRSNAAHMSFRSEDVRRCIVGALDRRALKSIKATQISAFLKGDSDIRLREIQLDSLGRMDVLVAIEVEFGVVITPKDFAGFRYLGNVVACTLSRCVDQRSADDGAPDELCDVLPSDQGEDVPPVVGLFRRAFRSCATVAHLNKVLVSFERYLTPTEFELLYRRNCGGHLIPQSAPERFHLALDDWFRSFYAAMVRSGKNMREPYVAKRLGPFVKQYIGPGTPEEKSLLVCFSPMGGRSLMIPNAVLLQYLDAQKFDVILVSEPLNQAYRRGVPFLGKTVAGVAEAVSQFDEIGRYRAVRILGCSAGCDPAIILASQIKAELTVCVGGRFHASTRRIKVLRKAVLLWWALRNIDAINVLSVYTSRLSRDRRYAKFLNYLGAAKLVEIKLSDNKVRHGLLAQLEERGELGQFFNSILFASLDSELIQKDYSQSEYILPGGTLRFSN